MKHLGIVFALLGACIWSGWCFAEELAIASAPSKHAIGSMTLSFFDSSRGRPLITEVLYPTTETLRARIPITDPPSLDRVRIHRHISDSAQRFFSEQFK